MGDLTEFNPACIIIGCGEVRRPQGIWVLFCAASEISSPNAAIISKILLASLYLKRNNLW